MPPPIIWDALGHMPSPSSARLSRSVQLCTTSSFHMQLSLTLRWHSIPGIALLGRLDRPGYRSTGRGIALATQSVEARATPVEQHGKTHGCVCPKPHGALNQAASRQLPVGKVCVSAAWLRFATLVARRASIGCRGRMGWLWRMRADCLAEGVRRPQPSGSAGGRSTLARLG